MSRSDDTDTTACIYFHVSSFLKAFQTIASPSALLNEHFVLPDHTNQTPKITEHGPAWARTRLPFLGRTFRGRKTMSSEDKDPEMGTTTCDAYFTLLAQTLDFIPNENSFPESQNYVFNPNAVTEVQNGNSRGVMTLVGQGKFRASRTGIEWEERFTYRLSEFDEKGRIGHWEIWADPLSAWMAVTDQEMEQRDSTEPNTR
ncbi:MAG: hypothetical protein M1817_005025 [Caeruleum heppii]|nr:MAG: hypothetical protein M1817_005025 [Caeruleum heppii]